MKKNPESKQVTKKDNWQFLFELKHNVNHKYHIIKYCGNSKMNQIKEVEGQEERIISCPIELDFIICSYLIQGDSNVFIKKRLLRVINAMLTNGCNDCPKWIEYHQMLSAIWNDNVDKGIIPNSSSLDMMVDTHSYLYESYATEDW
jgi:hypothetical protein